MNDVLKKSLKIPKG